MRSTDRVTEYALQAVNDTENCCELHRLACQRHLNDLERQGTEDFPYYWDVDDAMRVIEYAETLSVLEGYGKKPLRLLGSQAFDLGCLFGWKNNKGYRRFRTSYRSMARQNGKTMFNGITGSYVAGFSGYNFGKLFTVATKKRQAKLAWDETARFITSDEDLSSMFEVKEYKTLIECNHNGCTIEALSREGGLDDGFRSIFSSIDEIHQHKDNGIFKALENGTRALPETLLSMITTRGFQLNSFCKEQDDYAIDILKGRVSAEKMFVDIFTLDKGDDPFDEKNFIKANPYLATTEEGMEALREAAQKAQDLGAFEYRDYMTKVMNCWAYDVSDVFVDPDAWHACGGEDRLEELAGSPCYVGLDLSSGGDLTTLALEFEMGEKTYLHTHSFMPRGRMIEHIKNDKAPYDVWEQSGLITVTGGEFDYKNDYKFIIKELARLRDSYDLQFLGIGIDPHNADGILDDLEQFGCPVVTVYQTHRELNDATEDMRLLVKNGAVEYDEANELMTWSFLNAKLVRNYNDEVKIDKKYGRFKRIDPVDACIDAHNVRIKMREDFQVDTENELQEYLDTMGW